MKTFLIAVLGVLLGGILLLIVLVFGIKLLLRRFLKKIVAAFEGFGSGVPPFRIALHSADDLKWMNEKAIEAATDALMGLGYERIGDFRIDEMPLVRLRALVNPQTNTYGVVFEPNIKSVVLDIACDFVDGEHVTVSTAPETGLDRPDFSRLVRVEGDVATDAGVVATVHERMVAEQKGRPTVAATAEAFPAIFAAAHAREMDWRIARGGVTVEEVRRSQEVAGKEPPDDDAVKLVQMTWRTAIAQFVDERLRAKFTNYLSRMSAADWEKVRDRLYFVHEHSNRELMVEQLNCHLVPSEESVVVDSIDGKENGDDHDEAKANGKQIDARLQPLFADLPIRDAFAKAQELLPTKQRYRRLVGIKKPYMADVYVRPKSAEFDGDES